MNREKIQDLEGLLKDHIGARKIKNVEISRLTAPGENYGGLLLRVDVTLEAANGEEDELHVISKCIPTNTFMQKIFNIQVTVEKEIAFYDTIVPLLQQFQRDQGVSQVMDLFPKLYGGRINLNGSDVVDEDAAIILENLVNSGYTNVKRTIGYDLPTAKLVLKNLATFHSVPLALKTLKPEVFEEKITPHLTEMGPPSQPPPGESDGGGPMAVILEVLEGLEEFRSVIPILKERFEKGPWNTKKDPRPFFTISHGDMWCNNTMVKFENGKPVASKFVDFQNYALGSPAHDLLFLVMSSVQESVLREDFDDLIKLYHDKFIENLEELKCDTTPFLFEKFLEEVKVTSEMALGQTLGMVANVILAKEGGFIQVNDPSKPPSFGTKDDITPQAIDRVVFVLRKYKEKGWL